MHFKFSNGQPIAIEDLKLVFVGFMYAKSSICSKSSENKLIALADLVVWFVDSDRFISRHKFLWGSQNLP